MRAGRRRRMRLKSKRGARKNHKASRRVMPDNDAPTQFESKDTLLLSSLRYWEVERDLIEERIAILRSLTVPS